MVILNLTRLPLSGAIQKLVVFFVFWLNLVILIFYLFLSHLVRIIKNTLRVVVTNQFFFKVSRHSIYFYWDTL